MKTTQLSDKYKELKENLAKDKNFTPEQIDYYLLGWLDCSLYVIREGKEND